MSFVQIIKLITLSTFFEKAIKNVNSPRPKDESSITKFFTTNFTSNFTLFFLTVAHSITSTLKNISHYLAPNDDKGKNLISTDYIISQTFNLKPPYMFTSDARHGADRSDGRLISHYPQVCMIKGRLKDLKDDNTRKDEFWFKDYEYGKKSKEFKEQKAAAGRKLLESEASELESSSKLSEKSVKSGNVSENLKLKHNDSKSETESLKPSDSDLEYIWRLKPGIKVPIKLHERDVIVEPFPSIDLIRTWVQGFRSGFLPSCDMEWRIPVEQNDIDDYGANDLKIAQKMRQLQSLRSGTDTNTNTKSNSNSLEDSIDTLNTEIEELRLKLPQYMLDTHNRTQPFQYVPTGRNSISKDYSILHDLPEFYSISAMYKNIVWSETWRKRMMKWLCTNVAKSRPNGLDDNYINQNERNFKFKKEDNYYTIRWFTVNRDTYPAGREPWASPYRWDKLSEGEFYVSFEHGTCDLV